MSDTLFTALIFVLGLAIGLAAGDTKDELAIMREQRNACLQLRSVIEHNNTVLEACCMQATLGK